MAALADTPAGDLLAVTGFERVSDVHTAGRGKRVTWDALVQRLSTHTQRDSKDGPGWSPALFTDPCTCGRDSCPGAGGHRIDANVLELHALVFDLDKRSDRAPLDEASALACLKRLDDLKLRRVVHTTHSHDPAGGHWSLRVVIALSRPVPRAEWERFWRAAVEQIQIHVEPSCFNPARFWFAPSARPGTEPWSQSHDGIVLDVDMVLDVAPAPAPPPRAQPRTRDPRPDKFDIYRFMSERYPGARARFDRDLTRWDIECPWEGEHSSKSPRDTMVSWSSSTGPGFCCLHDHCRDRHWADFREHHEPGYRERAAEREQEFQARRARKQQPADDLSRARQRRADSARQESQAANLGAEPQLPLRHAGLGPEGGYRCTDLGNARRFADMHRDSMRYVHAWSQWLVWDSKRWRRDDIGWDVQAAKRVTAQICMDAARMMASAAAAINAGGSAGPSGADALVKWAGESSNAGRIKAMLAMARSEPEIAAPRTAFDNDLFALNVQNGTIDLRSGELRPHRQSDMITRIATVEYDPTATAPEWEKFLNHVLPDPEVRTWLQRFAGYSLTGDVGEQCLAFCFGDGANGKSVFLDVVLKLLGDYALRAAPDLVLAKMGEAHPTELADLEGRRFVVCSEIDQGKQWNEGLIKRITGDATITARRMREDFFTFRATHKLLIAANTKPRVRGTDNGIWRRMKLVPWPVIIAEHAKDKQLAARLIANEGPGILAWLVRGCLGWQNHGLQDPRAVRDATAEYRQAEDVLGRWIEDCCQPTTIGWYATSKLYESYSKWCETEGEGKPWKRLHWKRALEERGYAEGRNPAGTERVIKGLSIKEWQ